MSEFLKNHAIQNIWCAPEQDLSAIFRPTYATTLNGLYETLEWNWQTHVLPTTERYKVYSMGHLPPVLRGIESSLSNWMSLSEICGDSSIQIDLYLEDGTMLPRFEAYLYYLENKTLLLAVKELRDYQFANEIFIRFYSNAFFQSERFNSFPSKPITTSGARKSNSEDCLTVINEINALKADGKIVQIWRNGLLVPAVAGGSLVEGEWIEYLYDASIRDVEEFTVSDLHFFNSTMDSKYKYFIQLLNAEGIEFYDDLDFYVVDKKLGASGRAKYLHRNDPGSVRMITHSSYSIPVATIEYFTDDLAQTTIRVFKRHSGYSRDLVFESRKLHELYKFGADVAEEVLTNEVSLPSFWKLTEMEQGSYPKLISSDPAEFYDSLLYGHYNYDAAAYYSAYTPQTAITVGDTKAVMIPECYVGSTVYGYTDAGVMVNLGQAPSARSMEVGTDIEMVDFISGVGDERSGDLISVSEVSADLVDYVKAYRRIEDTERFVDITKDITWTIDGDTATHDYDVVNNQVYFRDTRLHYFFEREVYPYRGGIRLALPDGDGTVEVPYRDIAVRLNDRELVKDAEFFVKKSTLYIVRKDVINSEGSNKLQVLAFGTPTADSETGEVDWGTSYEWGWITNGCLSRDHTFNIRDDVLARCVVAGERVKKETMQYHEDDYDQTGTLPNGEFYSFHRFYPNLQHIDIPVATEETMFKISMENTEQVSEFLTARFPPPEITEPSLIGETIKLVSPFMARILFDMTSGTLTIPDRRMADREIKVLVASYEYLLDYDPAYINSKGMIDDQIVEVHPHLGDEPVSVTVAQFSVMERISELYLQSRVDNNLHLRIN